MRLNNKVALISGAAHGIKRNTMGFGGAIAWLFAEEGAKVVLADIDEESGNKTACQIRQNGGAAIFIPLNVTLLRDWKDAVQKTVNEFGQLDILVNNAGIPPVGTIENISEESWDMQMAVHAKGAYFGAQSVISEMRKSGGGSIINISSIFGIIGSAGSSGYPAAKGAIRMFSKSAALQFAKYGVRVNTVHPGFCDTPFPLGKFNDSEFQKITKAKIPMGRYGRSEEIAYAVLYLASDESAYVTGSELVVDGGVIAQ